VGDGLPLVANVQLVLDVFQMKAHRPPAEIQQAGDLFRRRFGTVPDGGGIAA